MSYSNALYITAFDLGLAMFQCDVFQYAQEPNFPPQPIFFPEKILSKSQDFSDFARGESYLLGSFAPPSVLQ